MRLIFVVICLGMCASAQALDIVDIQWHLDLSGSIETGTSIPFSGGSTAYGSTQIELGSLTPGIHRLSVRARDANGRWSLFSNRMVYRALSAAPLAALRYRFDDGPDQVLALSPLGDGTWLADGMIGFPPGAEPGFHVLRIWALDSIGKASLYSTRLICNVPPGQNRPITRFSWFFTGHEADPEQVYHHEVASAQIDITQDLILTLPALSPGLTYKLNLYAVREDGSRSFRVSYAFVYHLSIENLTIVLDGDQIVLAWDEVPSALHYLLESKNDPLAEGAWQQVMSNGYSLPASEAMKFFRVKVVK